MGDKAENNRRARDLLNLVEFTMLHIAPRLWLLKKLTSGRGEMCESSTAANRSSCVIVVIVGVVLSSSSVSSSAKETPLALSVAASSSAIL